MIIWKRGKSGLEETIIDGKIFRKPRKTKTIPCDECGKLHSIHNRAKKNYCVDCQKKKWNKRALDYYYKFVGKGKKKGGRWPVK